MLLWLDIMLPSHLDDNQVRGYVLQDLPALADEVLHAVDPSVGRFNAQERSTTVPHASPRDCFQVSMA